jgi:hypothetical protein
MIPAAEQDGIARFDRCVRIYFLEGLAPLVGKINRFTRIDFIAVDDLLKRFPGALAGSVVFIAAKASAPRYGRPALRISSIRVEY